MNHLRSAAQIGFAAALACLLSACSEVSGYRGPSTITIPPNVQKIGVRPFRNRTQFFGLEDKLRLRVEEEFIRDGRLPFVNREAEADGVVDGEIVNYIRQVVTYDANNQPQEFRLWVIMNVRFIQRADNVLLWEEPRLEQEYRYFVETSPGGRTEEEAREVIWDFFARDIVKRTIEGFGSVSSASEKKVPTETLPSNDATPTIKPQTAPPTPQVAPPLPY